MDVRSPCGQGFLLSAVDDCSFLCLLVYTSMQNNTCLNLACARCVLRTLTIPSEAFLARWVLKDSLSNSCDELCGEALLPMWSLCRLVSPKPASMVTCAFSTLLTKSANDVRRIALPCFAIHWAVCAAHHIKLAKFPRLVFGHCFAKRVH